MRTQTTSNETVEMYLKTVAELSDGRNPIVIARVAERLGVTPVSANEMMKRLVEQGLLEHERYKGVTLTKEGRYIAHSVIRRQRLWECFLTDHLGFNWAGVYEASCRLEHATSNILADALDAYLGHPTHCPHGSPIPDRQGQLPASDDRHLSSFKVGESGHIARVEPTAPDIFAYFNRHQILPDRPFTVVEIGPLDGPITLEVGGARVALGRQLAELVIAHGGAVNGQTAVPPTFTTLDQLTPGQTATVQRISADRPVRRRMMDMGITRGVPIEMVKASPFGDPIEYKLRGYSLSLRKTEAQMVEIKM
jgi:DtxR family transcriptional regulator, Mn-dependent transcriptional regulator